MLFTAKIQSVPAVIVDATGNVVRRFNLTPANVVMKDGKPVIGPMVRRPLTIREIMSRNLAPSKNKAGDMRRDGHPDVFVPFELSAAA